VIRERVTLVLAVLPFERRCTPGQVPVEFVGHPIADALVGAPSRADARRRLASPTVISSSACCPAVALRRSRD